MKHKGETHMAFFDELGKKLTQGSQDMVQKTKDTAEVLKLNNIISDAERSIENLYSQLGKAYFELHADSSEDALSQIVSDIKFTKNTIFNCQKEIQQIKGLFLCTNCGANLDKDALFCSRCGTKIDRPVETPATVEETVYHCKKCGAPVSEDYAFCINCGTKAEREPVVTGEIESNPEKDTTKEE